MYPKLGVTSRALIYGCASVLSVAVVHAQATSGPPSEANHFIETPKGWTQPKTPWGDPDIQGMWPISFVGSVPPEMTAEGKRLSALMKSSWALPGETQTWDSYLDFDSWDRCITRGMPSSMMPYRYNNGVRIVQVPGYVILDLEMVHETRIVPVDGRPALSPTIKKWMGESRGHWEGNTLVIETTNFKPGPSATNIGVMGSPPGNRFPVSEQMKITERITRLNDDFLLYEIKTEDPVVLTRPWTARYPLKLDPSYEWWEYACHEGNRTIGDYINSSRAERARQSEAK